MLHILWTILIICMTILVVIASIVLLLNIRVQQLKKDKYTDLQRSQFVSWVLSWATPLLFNMKVESEGLEKINQVKNGVIYANHQSNFDIITLLNGVKRPHGYVSKKELDHIFLLSDAMRLIHCEFMDRSDIRQSVKVISRAAESVKNGHIMVIFPEGTREIQSPVGTFKAGSFKLAQKAKADIIPITIFNSYEVGKRWPRKTVVKFVVHDPIAYENYSQLSTNEVCEMVEEIIKAPLKLT